MTNQAWQTGNDVLAMLDLLFPVRGFDSHEPQTRKSRLFLIACALRVWDQLPGVCRAIVRVAEQVYGSRLTNKPLRDQVYPQAEALYHCRGNITRMNEIGRALVQLKLAKPADVKTDGTLLPDVLAGVGQLIYGPFSPASPVFRHMPVELLSADLVREIFVNPSRPMSIKPKWLTSTVLALAQGIDEDRAFDRMPILADALQDAGCDNDAILNHLRDTTTTHAVGCWALDLVLGESEASSQVLARRSLPA